MLKKETQYDAPGPDRIQAVFVCHRGSLTPAGGGGVQLCTREYFETLTAAGFDLTTVEVDNDRRLLSRMKRRISPNPYRNSMLKEDVIAEMRRQWTPDTSHVFLNQATTRPLAPAIKREFGGQVHVSVLSHGLRSVDFFHEARARSGGNPSRQSLLSLANQLFDENSHSESIDHVFCVAPFEMEIEKWLGARSVSFVPRTIRHTKLNWNPVVGRIGYVGQLDHPPNEEGLKLFLKALGRRRSDEIRVRVVGGPAFAGRKVAREFKTVEFLGRLSDDELEREAATWTCFLHPVFCYAMGVSTKLAVGIGWELPIVATSMGCRGYVWEQGIVPTADTPEEFAELVCRIADTDEASRVQGQISLVKHSSPTAAKVASLVAATLNSLENRESGENCRPLATGIVEL